MKNRNRFVRLKLKEYFLLVGHVSGDGAWNVNHDYKYKLNGNSFMTTSETKNKFSGVVYRACLSIRPQSTDLLIGQLSQYEYAEVRDREYFEITNASLVEEDLEFISEKETTPFKIHLENGVINGLSVDKTMTPTANNELKIMLSLFQVNTNAQNVIEATNNQLPNGKDNNAKYKVMEPVSTGNCETHYDISKMPEDMMNLIPLPLLNDNDSEFVKIAKGRNNSNCDKFIGYQYALTADGHSTDETSTDDANDTKPDFSHMDEEASLIIVSGSLKSYTIQLSFTVQHITANDKSKFYRKVSATLESVEQSVSNAETDLPEDLMQIGSLVLDTSSNADAEVAFSDLSLTQLQAGKLISYFFSLGYWP